MAEIPIPIDFYAEIVATVAMGIVWVAIMTTYFADPERDKRTLAISVGYAFFSFATFAGLLGIVEVVANYPDVDALSLALFIERFVYIFVAFGAVAFTYFTVKLFFVRGGWATYVMTVIAIILSAVYLFVPDSVVSIPGAPTVWNTNLLTGIALLLMTSVVFAVLCVKCFQTARKASEPLMKRRFKMIGIAALFGILIFIVNAFTVVFDPSVIPYISATSWSLSAVAGILSYIGWVRYKGRKSR